MIDKSFIEKILELAPTNLLELGDRQFTDKKIYQVNEPQVAPIFCHTLTGLVDFFDALPVEVQQRVLFHVEDFNKVSIVSEIFGVEKQRETFITANAYNLDNRFDRYMGHEDFMVFILAQFVQDETTSKVLRIVGNLKSEAGATYSDDGLTQTVTAKTGITKVENIDLPNPITLRPFRTFSDIDQPESKFILRLKQRDGISVALFEADGGAWKNQAIASIKAYLEERKIGSRVIA
jgi:hypothetical protein